MALPFARRKSNARNRPNSQTRQRYLPCFEGLEERIVPFVLSGYSWGVTNLAASFVPDGTSAEGTTSALFSHLDSVANTADWQEQFARALQSWANASTLNFHFVPDDGTPTGSYSSDVGDIRLAAINMSESALAYAYYPTGSNLGGDIFLNTDYTFRVGSTYDLYSVLLHELGHSLGIRHSDVSGAIMGPYYQGVVSGLTADDISAIQAIYGARQHDSFDQAASNDSFGSATGLTVSSSGTFAADLTTMADVDYYRVTAPTDGDGTLTVSVDASGLSLLAPSLLVYDASGTLMGSASGSYGTVATVTLSGLTPGSSYTIVADGATSDEFGMGAYVLDVAFGGTSGGGGGGGGEDPTPPPGMSADRFETNETMATATDFGRTNSVSEAGLTVHNSSDIDVFKFTSHKSSNFVISAQFGHANGNLDLFVYDANGNVIGSSESLTDNESVTLSLTSGQTYYVKVMSPDGGENTYDLAIQKTGGGGGGQGGGGGGKGGGGQGGGKGKNKLTAGLNIADVFHVDGEDHHEHDGNGAAVTSGFDLNADTSGTWRGATVSTSHRDATDAFFAETGGTTSDHGDGVFADSLDGFFGEYA